MLQVRRLPAALAAAAVLALAAAPATASGPAFVRAFGKGVNSSDGSDVCATSCKAGTIGGAAGALSSPEATAVAGAGDVYVADYYNNRIDEYGQDGSFVRAFGKGVSSSDGSDICTTSCQAGSAGGFAGQLNAAAAVAIGDSGDVFVADQDNQRIDVFTPTGTFLRAFGKGVNSSDASDVCTTSCQAGSSGIASGQLNYPSGIAVAGSGDLYVADFNNNRIDEFTQAGAFVRAFGKGVNSSDASDVCTTSCQTGSVGGAAGQLSSPAATAVAGSGAVYVADYYNNRIVEYDSSGNFVRAFGKGVNSSDGSDVCTTSCQAGTNGGAAGRITHPDGVAVVGSGDIYVADQDNSRIDEFTQGGVFVRAFGADVGGSGVNTCTATCQTGTTGEAAGEFHTPAGPAVAGSGDIYVADITNQRIDEWDVGSQPAPVKLTVMKKGTGAGTVTSAPSGINCGTTCTHLFAHDASVALYAAAATGSTFAGWSGACSGLGVCHVTMQVARTVTATFDKKPKKKHNKHHKKKHHHKKHRKHHHRHHH